MPRIDHVREGAKTDQQGKYTVRNRPVTYIFYQPWYNM